jgi:hypothetical protein
LPVEWQMRHLDLAARRQHDGPLVDGNEIASAESNLLLLQPADDIQE